MISFFINFLFNTISESHLGAQIIIVGGIIILLFMGAAKLYKVLPKVYVACKEFFLNRERRKEEAESTQQRILSNQDSILNNYKNVETLNKSVADLAKLTNKISDEYRQISAIMEQVLSRVDSLETAVPELQQISDHRDNELIVTIKNQTDTLNNITERIDSMNTMIELLTESDLEEFRVKLMTTYKDTLRNNNTIELHTYRDLYKGMERYKKQGGNSYAEEVWNEITKCKKVISHPELYNEDLSDELTDLDVTKGA